MASSILSKDIAAPKDAQTEVHILHLYEPTIAVYIICIVSCAKIQSSSLTKVEVRKFLGREKLLMNK